MSEIAAKIADLLRAAIDVVSPGGLEFEVSYGERALPKIINIPKKVVVATRKRAKKITLIDQWDKEPSKDLASLAEALHQIPFYYGLIGMGADNTFKMLSQEIASIEPGTLPLGIDRNDAGDAEIILLVLSHDKERMVNLHNLLLDCVSKREFTPSSLGVEFLESTIWVVLDLSDD